MEFPIDVAMEQINNCRTDSDVLSGIYAASGKILRNLYAESRVEIAISHQETIASSANNRVMSSRSII